MSERKHKNIINLREVEAKNETKGDRFAYSGKRLGVHVGARSIGTSYFEVPPGKQAFPHHFHSANEEAAFVIEGQGQVRIGKETIEIEAGDYISFPVGPDSAHSIYNHSKAPLRMLAISTLNPVEVVGYPDSKKYAFFALDNAAKGFMSTPSPWVRLLVKDQTSVDYYDGEDLSEKK